MAPANQQQQHQEGLLSDQAKGVRRITWLGLAVNLALVAVKFAAGYYGRSQAVLADAVHSLSDSVTDVVLLIGLRYWAQPPDETHPHGHRRIETLVTIAIGLSLAVVGLGLGWHALDTLRSGHRHVPGVVALVAAVLSIVLKEWLYRITIIAGRRLKSSAVTANAWHHRSDALSSLPVAIAVGAAIIRPDWAVLDQVSAMLVTLFILYAAWKITHPALAELVDAGASAQVRQQLAELAQGVEGVINLHHLRTRFMGGRLHVDLHIRVDARLTVHEGHEIAHRVRDKLVDEGPDVVDVLVHVEPHEL
jgi:cation diffusion facilitator family transporter